MDVLLKFTTTYRRAVCIRPTQITALVLMAAATCAYLRWLVPFYDPANQIRELVRALAELGTFVCGLIVTTVTCSRACTDATLGLRRALHGFSSFGEPSVR